MKMDYLSKLREPDGLMEQSHSRWVGGFCQAAQSIESLP
jgi:hypothetical protein